MKTSTNRLKIALIVAALIVVAGAGAVTYAVTNPSNKTIEPEISTEPVVTAMELKPSVYVTQDGLSRYVKSLESSGDIQKIRPNDIHDIPDLDWNEEAIVAVQFSLPAGQSYQSAAIETVDGEKAIVVDVLGVAQGCNTVAVNYEHVAFVKISQDDAQKSYKAILRTTPNTASCPSN